MNTLFRKSLIGCLCIGLLILLISVIVPFLHERPNEPLEPLAQRHGAIVPSPGSLLKNERKIHTGLATGKHDNPLRKRPDAGEPDDLRVTVTDCGSGGPIPNATVSLLYAGILMDAAHQLVRSGSMPIEDLLPVHSQKTDNYGEAAFHHLAEGAYDVRVESPGFVTRVAQHLTPPYDSTVCLSRQRTHTIRFLLQSGTPVAGFPVWLDQRRIGGPLLDAISDSTGVVASEDLSVGTLLIALRSQTHAFIDLNGELTGCVEREITQGPCHLELQLAPAEVRIETIVVSNLQASEVPIENAEIRLENRDYLQHHGNLIPDRYASSLGGILEAGFIRLGRTGSDGRWSGVVPAFERLGRFEVTAPQFSLEHAFADLKNLGSLPPKVHLAVLKNEPEVLMSLRGSLAGLRFPPGILHFHAQLCPNLELARKGTKAVYLGVCPVSTDSTFRLNLSERNPTWPWIVDIASRFSYLSLFDPRVTCGLLLEHVAGRGTEFLQISSDGLAVDRLRLVRQDKASKVPVFEFADYDLGEIQPIDQVDLVGKVQVLTEQQLAESPGERVVVKLERDYEKMPGGCTTLTELRATSTPDGSIRVGSVPLGEYTVKVVGEHFELRTPTNLKVMSEMPPLEILVQRIQLSPGVIALNWADKSREEEVLELQASWKGGSMVSKLEDQQPQLPITALPLHCTSLRLRLKVLKPNDLIEGYGGWRFSSTASTTAEIPLLRTEVGEEPDGLLLRFDAPMIVREPERPPWLSDDLTVHGRLDAPDGDIPATEVILYVNSTPDQPQTVRESSVVWTSMVRLGGPPRLIKADGTFSFFLDARAFNVKGSGFTPEELFNIARTHGLVVGTNLSGPKPVISPFIIPLIQIPFAALSDPIILNVEKN